MTMNTRLDSKENRWITPAMSNDEFIAEAKEAYPGWAKIIQEANDKMTEIDPDYYPVQIKEKFGGLRFYFKPSNSENYNKLEAIEGWAETQSFKTCETCGTTDDVETKPNEGRYWILTLCEKCRKERS